MTAFGVRRRLYRGGEPERGWRDAGVLFLAYAAAGAATYDAILMDVRMPGMDGLEATRAIRAADAPILAVTADVMRDDVECCRAAGMNGHVPKPINPARLTTALMTVLDGGDAFPEPAAAPRVAAAA